MSFEYNIYDKKVAAASTEPLSCEKTSVNSEKTPTSPKKTSEDEYQVAALSDEDVDVTTDLSENKAAEPNSAAKEAPGVSIGNEGVDIKSFKKLIEQNSELDDLVAEYGYDKIFNVFDKDGNSFISDDEVKALGLSSNLIKDLSVEDIKKLAKEAGLPEISNNVTEDEPLSDELLAKLKAALLEDGSVKGQQAGAPEAAYSAGGAAPMGGGYSTGGIAGSSSGAASNVPDEMSLEQLKAEQKTKQDAVDKAGANLAEIKGGTNKEIVAAQEDADEKQEKYEKLLKEDDEISEELKEKQKENSEAIKENENDIKDHEKGVQEADNEISNLDNTITSLNSKIDALNGSLKALPAKTEENKDRHSEIDAMAKQIQDQILAAESEKTGAENKKKETEKTKSTLEDELDELNNTNKELVEEREKIEKEIEKSASDETKDALKEYQEARENVGKVKDELLTTAESELKTAQEELEKVNSSINELEAMQLQLKNRVGGKGEDVVEFAKKLDGLSASEMKQIMQNAGCRFDDGAWCADFATYVTKQVYGNDATPGDFAKSCSNTAYCPTIESWAKSNGAWTTNSSEIEPGDYILYTRDGRAGHIGIVTSVNSDGSVNTIEGNTSDDNGSYSSGVVNQHSNVTNARGFVKMHALS